jgi:ferredoxin
MNRLYAQLCQYDPADWRRAIDAIAPKVHEIDRTATRIWFAFWPLELHLACEAARKTESGAETTTSSLTTEPARKFGLMGRWRLADQIDESHRFLYAHRYWPQVKTAACSDRDWPDPLPELVATVADAASRRARTDREMLLGMSAVALMTLRQVGPADFGAAPGRIHLSQEARRMSPHQVLGRRAKDDWQGLFGFMRGLKKRWTVTFDENDPAASFLLIHGQEIATAAQADKREYRSKDPRCTPGEGPIPVECRAASCGTCWIGVLAGAEKLSPVVQRDERMRMKVFGYCDTDEPRPIIRLACQARAFGAVSVVIPPWNGMFGSVLSKQRR